MSTRGWRVYDGDLLVLEIEDRPGPLTSTAPRAPGSPPMLHPFLTGRARSAVHEDALRTALDGATSTPMFLDRLRGAGLTIRDAREDDDGDDDEE